jgi:hypothetical protein
MKCSNPDCNRGIGLIAYRRGWFSGRRYCSRHCRDAFVAGASKPQNKRSATTYFEWLFEQPVLNAQLKLVPAAIPARSKPGHRFGLAGIKLNAAEPGYTNTDFVELVTLDEDGPTGSYFHDGSPVTW